MNVTRSIGLLIAVLSLILGGCNSAQSTEPADVPRFDEPAQHATGMAWPQLAERYNRRVARIEQMWARAVIEITWIDEQGDSHYEQGDGPLIVRLPDELALAIGKLGDTYYWLGCNAERYWLIDRNPHDDQPDRAYVGDQARITEMTSADLPLPIAPYRLVPALGLTPLPAHADARIHDDPAEPHVLALVPVESGTPSANWCYWIDRETWQPRRIALLDQYGRLIAAAQLSDYQPLELHGLPPGAWPDVPARIELHIPQRNVRATLHLEEPLTDGRERDKVKDVQFDFDQLINRLHVDKVIDLDASPPAGP